MTTTPIRHTLHPETIGNEIEDDDRRVADARRYAALGQASRALLILHSMRDEKRHDALLLELCDLEAVRAELAMVKALDGLGGRYADAT